MIDRFARVQAVTYKPDIRRIAVLAVLIGAIGASWHFARPTAIRFAAQKSLGLPSRTALIRDALNGIYPALPERPGQQYPQSFWEPSPGCATWPIDPIMQYSGGRRVFVPARHVFVDGRLDQCGLVRSEWPFISAPHTDRDGRLVTVFQYNAVDSQRVVVASALIRLGPKTNEIVGLFAIDMRSKKPGIRQIHPGWRDEDEDGIPEFVVLEQKFASTPQARTWVETLAVARWNAAQTALQVVRVPSDGGVVFWTPPDGRPYEFPRTAVIDDICRELLPLPDGFGLVAPPVTPPAPASTQSSQPAASHLSEPRP